MNSHATLPHTAADVDAMPQLAITSTAVARTHNVA